MVSGDIWPHSGKVQRGALADTFIIVSEDDKSKYAIVGNVAHAQDLDNRVEDTIYFSIQDGRVDSVSPACFDGGL